MEQTKGRILIIDDDPDMVAIASTMLRGEGYTCLTASGGVEGLEILRNQPVDLILLDVLMPGMDGLQVCAHLRNDAGLREIPVILLTCLDDYQTRRRAISLGVSEYVAKCQYVKKVFIRGQLLSSVETQIHSSKVRSDLRKAQAAADSSSSTERQR
jgi:CheY-like chemotaxis protein